FREPGIPIRTCGDAEWPAGVTGKLELGDNAAGRDAADLADILFGEPQIVIRARGDGKRIRIVRRNLELGHGAARRDPPDLVAGRFREPEIAVGTGGDPCRIGIACESWKFRDAERKEAPILQAFEP